jgi:hypothetical protein
MPLNVFPNIHASGSVPKGWSPSRQSPKKFLVYNKDLLRYLRSLLPGKWRKVIKMGTTGDVHYFEHQSGQVADVKFFLI